LKFVPKRVKLWFKSRLGFEEIDQADRRAAYDSILAGVQSRPFVTDQKVCIIKDWTLRHANYEAACQELGVPYAVLDLMTPDWVEKLQADQSAIYFFQPCVVSSMWRTAYEERAYFVSHVLRRNMFPQFKALWLYESKRRCAALLQDLHLPHPRTWVFHVRVAALQFADRATYPLVFKTDLGSDAVGVRLLQSPAQARRLIKQCFGRGFRSDFYDPRDRNYGQVFLQEYLPDVLEWRVIRIGCSYFAYQKGKKGQFHSGSKAVIFWEPPHTLLEFARRATETLGLNCVALDIFERSGQYWINEVQTYYGANAATGIYTDQNGPVEFPSDHTAEMMINRKSGRFHYDGKNWNFEEGDFSRNAGSNLRVKLAFELFGTPLPGYRT
jgi:hypothetical protein